MKILFAGNVANNGYMEARLMRKNGFDAYVLLEKNPPQNYDPLRFDPNLNNYPDWVLFYDKNKSSWKIDILKIMRSFDIIQGHYDQVIFGFFSRKPLVSQIVGSDLTELAITNSIRGRLLRFAYKNSKAVLFDGPTQKPILDRLKIKKIIFFPMLFDTEFFKPQKTPKGEFSGKFVVFHPTYLDWNVKGNDILIKGFTNFVKTNPQSILIIVDRGIDAKRTHDLVKKLSIEKNVHFLLGPLTSTTLRKYYNLSDVVADQFCAGNLGAIARETLCSGKPLLTYYLEKEYASLYGEAQPAINASNVSEVSQQLKLLQNENTRNDFEKKGIAWANKYHSQELIFQRMKILYEMILDNKSFEEIIQRLP